MPADANAAQGTPAAPASGTPAMDGDIATDMESEKPDENGEIDPSTPGKNQKFGKIERKKACFKGYDEEKAVFSTMATPCPALTPDP